MTPRKTVPGHGEWTAYPLAQSSRHFQGWLGFCSFLVLSRACSRTICQLANSKAMPKLEKSVKQSESSATGIKPCSFADQNKRCKRADKITTPKPQNPTPITAAISDSRQKSLELTAIRGVFMAINRPAGRTCFSVQLQRRGQFYGCRVRCCGCRHC